jgi:hypothetical protein
MRCMRRRSSRHSTSTACGIRVRRYRCPRLLSWMREKLSKTTQEASQACARQSEPPFVHRDGGADPHSRPRRYGCRARPTKGKQRSPWRANTNVFKMGDLVLFHAKPLPSQAVSAVGSTKLRPRFVGPFSVIGVHDNAYTLDLPSAMATPSTFYVGMLKPYHPAEVDDSASPTSSRSDERLGPSLAPSRPESGLGQSEQQAAAATLG